MVKDLVVHKAYPCSNFSICERHNERKNNIYSNPDIVQERSELNIHFKTYDGTYTQMFERLLAKKPISTRGLKKDADVFEEMVFDVNTVYFEEHAVTYMQRTFLPKRTTWRYSRSAVSNTSCPQLCTLTSATGASQRSLTGMFITITYIPVVEKEIKWTKRYKDKKLIRKVKEVIHQVSHSKKWASVKALNKNGNPIRDKNGKTVLILSYSLLLDQFFKHMKNAGFKDFESGELGSSVKHLSVLDYKIQQDQQRLVQI